MPTMPITPPQKVTAKMVHIGGRPMEDPTTRGYIRLPSTCWSITRNTTNISASMGCTSSSIKAPTPAPMYAPSMGISAPKATTEDISRA